MKMNNADQIKNGYVLFGAGNMGRNALFFLGKESVKYFIDNNRELDGKKVDGVEVLHYTKMRDFLKLEKVVICVSDQYVSDIRDQLEKDGIPYISLSDLKRQVIEGRIKNSQNNIETYKRSIDWIYANTLPGSGIINRTDLKKPYPEVTGYFIPTLLRWGHRELALQYAKWLCGIQKQDGSWYDTENAAPYIFDTAQVLKGLLAIRELFPDADENIMRGCEWILSNMTEDGRLVTPSKDAWGGNPDMCDEVIHIYCLSPLMEAGKVFGRKDFIEKARKCFTYYMEHYYEKIMNFKLLSHFYAYLMEALLDLGELETARKAMDNIAGYQDGNGAVPGYNNVNWVCSTGLFQLAMVWYRLGETEKGEAAFRYATRLQNPSGGWLGSYMLPEAPEDEPDYLPDAEISWANKFFLDALYYRNTEGGIEILDAYWDEIDFNDERYVEVRKLVSAAAADKEMMHIADIGCGRGRYLKGLKKEFPRYSFTGVDPYVSDDLAAETVLKKGILTCIPFPDASFDLTYTCEALEHAVDTEAAIREMARVTKPGGWICVIDKDTDHLGALQMGEWEQWFNKEELMGIMEKYCDDVKVKTDITHDGNASDAIFCKWTGRVRI